jgi:hypothetical protein
MFIPDPNFCIPIPGSRVKTIPDPGSASKNLIFLTQKIVSKLSDLDFLLIPAPESRGQKGTESRIGIRNTAHSNENATSKRWNRGNQGKGQALEKEPQITIIFIN